MGGSADTAGPLELWEAGLSMPDKKTLFLGAAKTHKKNGAPTFPGQDKIESVWRGSRGITVALQAECTLLAPCWEKHA